MLDVKISVRNNIIYDGNSLIGLYSATECKSNEHKYFINNMYFYDVLGIFKNIFERIETLELTDNSTYLLPMVAEKKYLKQAIMESDIKDMSIYMADGFPRPIFAFSLAEIDMESIKHIQDLTYPEFLKIYNAMKTCEDNQVNKSDMTLSMVSEVFKWDGI